MTSSLSLSKLLSPRPRIPTSRCLNTSSRIPCAENLARMNPSRAQSDAAKSCPSISRKLLWFHHIKSSKKKKSIVEWAKELKLGGYCKPGFPGVLVFEGAADDAADYLKRIKRMRWQHVQLRGEEEEQASSETQSVDSLRRFPMGIKELPESGMSDLGERCREANLEQLFLTTFKVSR